VTERKSDEDLPGTTPLGIVTGAGGLPRFELHVFLAGSSSSHVLPFGGSVTVGRSRSAEVCIDDASISRKHALLHVGSTVLVQDLGSQNGTRVGATSIPPHVNTPVEIGVPFVVGAVSVIVQPIGTAPVGGAKQPASGAPRAPGRMPLRDEVAALERSRIIEALAACGGNQTKAAAMLGIPRRTLVLRLAEYDIPRPRR